MLLLRAADFTPDVAVLVERLGGAACGPVRRYRCGYGRSRRLRSADAIVDRRVED